MPPDALYDALLDVARRLGLVIRVAAMDPKAKARGGLCLVRDTRTLIIDGGAPLVERIGVVAEALARFDLDAISMAPAVRLRIEKKQRIAPLPRPLAKTRG